MLVAVEPVAVEKDVASDMPRLELNGTSIDYRDAGDGPAVVLLHGFTGSRLDWFDHVGWLSERNRVVTYDHRGHGRSAHSGPYTRRQFSADLSTLVEHLGLDEVTLVGHSMGGVVAQDYAVLHPGRIRRLILVDTWPGNALDLPRSVARLATASSYVARAVGMERLLQIRAGLDRWLPQTGAGRSVANERPEVPVMMEANFVAMDPRCYASVMKIAADRTSRSVLDDLNTLDTDIHVISGAGDDLLRPSYDEYRRDLIGASFTLIDNAGHAPHIETPDEFRSVIESILKDDEQPSSQRLEIER